MIHLYRAYTGHLSNYQTLHAGLYEEAALPAELIDLMLANNGAARLQISVAENTPPAPEEKKAPAPKGKKA